jgi:hypothetical protein
MPVLAKRSRRSLTVIHTGQIEVIEEVSWKRWS